MIQKVFFKIILVLLDKSVLKLVRLFFFFSNNKSKFEEIKFIQKNF